MTDLEKMVAEFQARGGKVAKIETGARTLTESQVYRAVGFEPEKVYVFEVQMCGEDGSAFCEHVRATNKAKALTEAQRQWPESQVLSVEHKGTRDFAVYADAAESEW